MSWKESGGGTRGGTGDVKRVGDGDLNDNLPAFLVMALEFCSPGLASEFSSSYCCATFPSQLLYSAALFTDGVCFNGWVDNCFAIR